MPLIFVLKLNHSFCPRDVVDTYMSLLLLAGVWISFLADNRELIIPCNKMHLTDCGLMVLLYVVHSTYTV